MATNIAVYCNISQYIAMCMIFPLSRIVLYCCNKYCTISIYCNIIAPLLPANLKTFSANSYCKHFMGVSSRVAGSLKVAGSPPLKTENVQVKARTIAMLWNLYLFVVYLFVLCEFLEMLYVSKLIVVIKLHSQGKYIFYT